MRQLFSSIPGQVLDFIVVLVGLVIIFKEKIMVVLIGLVLIFKDQLTSLVNDIFDTITKKAGKV